ncbi:tumor necrosis factor receptor superfamily member 9 isoform X2 [Anolis sagrei]|uniref:tumor necrosis factor receptor superfamily member 9 isoform X2 n=1 Tax=Anolis sagrei TaxID=38937 RepID=UPI0035220FBA
MMLGREVRLLLMMMMLLRVGALPCPEGSYRDPLEGCLPCDVCDRRSYLRPCGPEANAVCRCPPGRECGGNTCVRCDCPNGQQPTKKGGCQRCPKGEFSNGTSGPCRPWSRCPPGLRIQTPGTEESDVVCQPELGAPTQPDPRSPSRPSLVVLAVACPAAALLTCLLLVLLLFRRWLRVQGKAQQGPFHRPAQEVDDLSFCFPEEEEGGREAFGAKAELEKVP